MLLVHTGGGDNINDEHFAVAGVFNLPHELGEHLARFPEWRVPTEDEAAAFSAAYAASEDDGDSGDQTDRPDFAAMKVADLRAHADAHSIDLGDATKKADLVAAIEAHHAAAAAEAGAEGEDDGDSESDDDSDGE